ncbi:MAG TPA: hypothetical protein VJT70_08490 [Sphingomicrobium sp.]|nr:hypothetical protein [Sphingomicrobium sp.]
MPLTGGEAYQAAFIIGGKIMTNAIQRSGTPWRIIGWGGAVALLAAPFIAMRFTTEVNWTASDFIFAGVLLGVIGGGFELAVWASSNRAYRAAAALALLGTFLVIWTNLAVGIVGSENNPTNLLFFGALLVGIAGSVVGRFRAPGMTLAMVATAVSLGMAFGIAVMGPTDEPFVPHSRELIGTGVFAALFLGSAALFRKAADQSSSSS